MTFEELLAIVEADRGVGVRTDSRRVCAGDVFVAVKGTAADGHDFIGQAVEKGAAYVVVQRPSVIPSRSEGMTPRGLSPGNGPPPAPEASDEGVAALADSKGGSSCRYVQVTDSSVAAAMLAQASNGYPASKLANLAVTGTNGKTTTAFLVRACINHARGARCGLMGTVVYDTGGGLYPSSLTTPDSLDIAARQAEMVAAGLSHMVIEASSHALSQNRLAGIEFAAAAFTNLTGDHLDYHKTEADYLAAKCRLFEPLAADAVAVLNAQSPHAKQIAARTKARVLWYAVDESVGCATCSTRGQAVPRGQGRRLPTLHGPHGAALSPDLTARIESMDVGGTVFTLELGGRTATVRTPLLGLYNVSNHLAAAGLCLAAGFDLDAVAAGLSSLDNVPGRLERLDAAADFSILIDYAHTDDALKNVLTTLTPLTQGRLIVVFGCGGDRDRTKRPRMAAVAEQLADCVIVTSDNPRTEAPDAIIREILTGFKRPTAVSVEPDRRKAIALAVHDARPDDVILIAGKGHEDYQIIGTKKHPFSDKEAALDALGPPV